VLVAAGQHLGAKQREPADACPTVVADSGVENVNSAVDAVKVTYSNSIIEAWGGAHRFPGYDGPA
jgi:hypothetical protein